MKVDVESMEPAFLRGAVETLARFRPTLVMEVFPPQMSAVMDILRPLGYERRTDDMGYHNYVFAHQSTTPNP